MPSGGRRSSSPWSGRTNGQKAAAREKEQTKARFVSPKLQHAAKRSWWIDPMTREEFMRQAQEEAAKRLSSEPNYERKDLA